MSAAVQPLTTIGHVTPRVDAIERVTGQATYTNDLKLPGMLYARVLRSPYPHARIRHIDSQARGAALRGDVTGVHPAQRPPRSRLPTSPVRTHQARVRATRTQPVQGAARA